MRYFTRNFNAFACCCSLLLLPLGGLADVERGAPEAPAKAPIHQHQQHHPHQQPQSVKLHQPAVPSSAAYHQPAPGTGAAQHPDGPAPQQPAHYHQQAAAASASSDRSLSRQPPSSLAATSAPPRPLETRNSYTVLSQAMSQAVHHEFDFLFLISGTYGSGAMAGDAGSACTIDDIDCLAHHDQLGMEAIRSLHQQLDDDDNGDIDLSESDDFLREELKYDSGYEKRHKAFHFNDDMHISVKELWEAWLRSEVHNWTVDQTTEWLAQSVQLPQYVPLFRLHKVTGKVLPRLAVNNMHYVSNVLGIKDPIHKQKIALKAMDAVLFGPPRETGTRWKDLLLVTLLLTAIIGSWYAYHQNKSAKIHIRRMAKDVEGLLKAEVALKEMQKELEQARIEQENVGKEKMDLERRLREAPTLSSSSSDLELQQLKQEIEVLRSELNRAEVEIHDHCWTPPQGLQSWLQLTYELENKHHIRKRIMAEKQLEQAREACEKLRKKRSSLVGAFVSTHGKSIDDVDRSIVEARNALNDVTNDLQERMHRWKQIETMLGFGIVNNSGIAHLENLLYNRNGVAGKTYRSRLSSSQDDLDDDSVQGYLESNCRGGRDDSSASDEGDRERDTVTFFLGGCPSATNLQMSALNTLNTGIVTPSTAAAFGVSVAGTPTGYSSTATTNSASTNLPNTSSSIGGGGGGGSYPSLSNYSVPPVGLYPALPSSSSLYGAASSTGGAGFTSISREQSVGDSLFQMARADSTDLVALESPTVPIPPSASTVSTPASFAPGAGGGGVVVVAGSAGPYHQQHVQHQLQQRFVDGKVPQQQQQQHQQHGPDLYQPARRNGGGSQKSAPVALGDPVAAGGGGGGGGGIGFGAGGTLPQLDDAGSTDSSLFDEDVKKRPRKLFSFGKRFAKSKKQQ
ncbi:stromal interaction molecule homolog isoform X3 [Anopheles arabiensis]|uniref:stromal interaction molecule homolog isoform X3 n=1 Tax=Anopheles arabiensis TaxID=7173 RepID=UPI001AAE1463|nr:stromal interaction molecule homolog isoform X3 [Anopheles arabiensis]